MLSPGPERYGRWGFSSPSPGYWLSELSCCSCGALLRGAVNRGSLPPCCTLVSPPPHSAGLLLLGDLHQPPSEVLWGAGKKMLEDRGPYHQRNTFLLLGAFLTFPSWAVALGWVSPERGEYGGAFLSWGDTRGLPLLLCLLLAVCLKLHLCPPTQPRPHKLPSDLTPPWWSQEGSSSAHQASLPVLSALPWEGWGVPKRLHRGP